IGEVFLDEIAPVAKEDHKIVVSVPRVELHDVPQDGSSADLDHWLGTDLGLLAEPSAEPAGEYCHFHAITSPYFCVPDTASRARERLRSADAATCTMTARQARAIDRRPPRPHDCRPRRRARPPPGCRTGTAHR